MPKARTRPELTLEERLELLPILTAARITEPTEEQIAAARQVAQALRALALVESRGVNVKWH